MDKHNNSAPVSLKNIQVTDTFWKGEMELVRKEVIPYLWDALNDRVEGAAPSFCMHNFKAAGKLNREKKEKGNAFVAPKYTYRGFEVLPEDPKQLKDDEFYGFVFQDSDFSKWIEAVGYSLTQHPDPELEKIADGAIDIVSVLVKSGLVSSRNEGRRAVEQGGVAVDGDKIPDISVTIPEEKFDGDGIVVRRGKKNFRKISK